VPNLTLAFKKQVGAFLLRLDRKEIGYSEDEWKIGDFLEDKGLARRVGPRPVAGEVLRPEQVHSRAMALSQSHFELSGTGFAFVAQQSEETLSSGRFLLPWELPWYGRAPWKYLLGWLMKHS